MGGEVGGGWLEEGVGMLGAVCWGVSSRHISEAGGPTPLINDDDRLL